MKKKLVTAVLAASLTVGLLPATVFATSVMAPHSNLAEIQLNSNSRIAPNGELSHSYRLAKYDVVNIAVLGFDEASFRDILVGVDGYVNLPYAGTVKLSGLTVPEATTLLKEKLGEYLKIPDLAVMIKAYGPRKVYVMGEVAKPGIYELPLDNMNIMSALSSANGIALKGRPKHVAVVRKIGEKIETHEVNFDRLVQKGDLSQNVILMDGDLVYVPRSNKIDISQDVMPILSSAFFFKSIIE